MRGKRVVVVLRKLTRDMYINVIRPSDWFFSNFRPSYFLIFPECNSPPKNTKIYRSIAKAYANIHSNRHGARMRRSGEKCKVPKTRPTGRLITVRQAAACSQLECVTPRSRLHSSCTISFNHCPIEITDIYG